MFLGRIDLPAIAEKEMLASEMLPSRFYYLFSLCNEIVLVWALTRSEFLHSEGAERDCDMMRLTGNGSIAFAQIPRKRIAADFVADEFGSFLSTVSPQQPFFAWIAFTEVHAPFIADPEGKLNASAFHRHQFNSNINDYVTCIENIDRAIGKVQGLLRRYGRLENTLIWFLSDNGPLQPGRIKSGSTGGLRGFKKTLFEGGVRTPALLFWPAKIQSNYRIDNVTCLADVRSTIRDILQSENTSAVIPVENVLDGESLLPMIESPATWKRNKDLVICSPLDRTTPRSQICRKYAVYRGHHKAIMTRGRELVRSAHNLLFDLKVDSGEQRDLVKSKVDVYRDLVSSGKSAVASILGSFRDNHCAYPPV